MSVTATINSLTYIDTIDQQQTTPLGDTTTVTVKVDVLVASVSCGSVADHPLYFAPEAVGNRMANYPGVDTSLLAVESLVRELIFGWSPSLTPADPTNPIDVNGGTDSRIDIAWASGADTSAQTVLDGLADRINAAKAAYSA
jgi:hypothetical protein